MPQLLPSQEDSTGPGRTVSSASASVASDSGYESVDPSKFDICILREVTDTQIPWEVKAPDGHAWPMPRQGSPSHQNRDPQMYSYPSPAPSQEPPVSRPRGESYVDIIRSMYPETQASKANGSGFRPGFWGGAPPPGQAADQRRAESALEAPPRRASSIYAPRSPTGARMSYTPTKYPLPSDARSISTQMSPNGAVSGQEEGQRSPTSAAEVVGERVRGQADEEQPAWWIAFDIGALFQSDASIKSPKQGDQDSGFGDMCGCCGRKASEKTRMVPIAPAKPRESAFV